MKTDRFGVLAEVRELYLVNTLTQEIFMDKQMSLTSTETIEPSPQNVLAMVLSNPEAINDLDADKLQTLFAIHTEHEDRQAKQEFIEAFHALRDDDEFKPIEKLGQSDVHSYARLDDISKMLYPLMSKHGFSHSISSSASQFEGYIRIELIVRHKAGHEERTVMDCPHDQLGRAGRSPVQGVMSAYTYVERNMLVKYWGIQATDDNDGNPVIEPISPQQAEEIKNMLYIVGAKESQITAVYGCDKVESLPSTLFQPAMRMLEQRAARRS